MTSVWMHPKYQRAALATMENVQFEKLLSADDNIVTATREKTTLSFLIENEVVTDAGHFGADGGERVVLERLCRLSIGRPLQEVAEHGLIYVEFEMRDPNIPSPVPGLLTPQNADPAFAAPALLARQCFEAFAKSVGIVEPERNFWSPRAGEIWSSWSETQKKDALDGAIKEISAKHRWFDLRFEVRGIVDTKITVSFATTAMNGAAIGHAMLVLEKELKALVEPQIEVALEDIEDRNKRLDRTRISRSHTETTKSL